MGDPDVEELVDVVRALAGDRVLEDVVDTVRHAARRLTGADGATFVLREGDHCHYVDEDAISPLWKGRRFPMSSCISGWAMEHKQAVVIEDIYADDRIPHDAYRPTFVQSLVMVPVRSADPVGAIGTYWAQRCRPTDEQVRTLQALADSTAVALENVRLYDELEHRVRARTQALEAANEDLRRFSAALAHDVRQPLTTIQGYADLLSSHYGRELSPDAQEATKALERAATNLSTFVGDLLAYATAGTRAITVGRVRVDDLVRTVTERLHQLVVDRRATIERQGEPELDGDPVLLSQALQNLVANALAYVPADRQPVVCVSVRDAGDAWELSVSDNGDGVPEPERATIFEPFTRGSSTAGRRGTGLGLALCRKVGEQHGGSIRVEPGPAGGASFVLRLAKPPVSP